MAVAAAFLSCAGASAQISGDVFNPVAKYIEQGDAESLSAWFSDNLEVSIFSRVTKTGENSSRTLSVNFKDYERREVKAHTIQR